MPRISDAGLARRLARAIVSDLLLYDADEVRAGIQRDDLFERMRERFDEARAYFETRVEPDLVLTVRDQGRGMGGDEQRRLLEPLAAAGRTGAGLGLAIVFQIVRQHGGDIAVLSAAGHGTQFDVRLPLVSVPVPA